jgi:hypothetical protein
MMTRPQTWDWTESYAADPAHPPQGQSWVAQGVFRPAGQEPGNGESGPELSLAEWELAASPVQG